MPLSTVSRGLPRVGLSGGLLHSFRGISFYSGQEGHDKADINETKSEDEEKYHGVPKKNNS